MEKCETIGLSRREREKRAHRLEILKAAERVFAEKGFDQATMDDVAKAAEFSVGAIYNFFANKDTLRAEVLDQVIDEFQSALKDILAAPADPLSSLYAIVALRLRYMEAHGPFFRRLMDARPVGQVAPDHAIPPSCQQRYHAYLEVLADVFAKAVSAGQARPGDAFYLALTLEGAINAYWAHWRRTGMALSMEERMEALRRNCLERIL